MPITLRHLPEMLAAALLNAAPLLVAAVATVVVVARRRAASQGRVVVLCLATAALGAHLVAVTAVTGFWVIGGADPGVRSAEPGRGGRAVGPVVGYAVYHAMVSLRVGRGWAVA